MKIKTLTFHRAINYGAVLQCYALQEVLKQRQDNVEVIDFIRNSDKCFTLVQEKGFKGFIKRVIFIPFYKQINKKYEKFGRFRSDNLELSKSYNSLGELERMPPDADIIFTGSDQVFNSGRTKDERKVFYLSFPCKYRASYAASFGSSDIPIELRNEIADYLKQFDALGLREGYAVDVARKLTSRTDVEHNIDPVFLLEKKKWCDVEEEYRGIPQKYILVFFLRESKACIEVAKKLAQKTGLPIVIITGKAIAPIRTKYVLRDVGPQNYLWLIRNCSYFVEDSFHATAFSIIFQKQFMFCDDHPQSYERGRALLDSLEMSYAYDYSNWDKWIFTEYDYRTANQIIENEKTRANAYLDKCINDARS